MSVALYDRARETVGRMLRKYGGQATISREQPGEYDPITNSYNSDSVDIINADVVIGVMRQQNADGIWSQATTARSKTEFKVGDIIALKAMSWRVIEVNVVAPDGNEIIYRATVETR